MKYYDFTKCFRGYDIYKNGEKLDKWEAYNEINEYDINNILIGLNPIYKAVKREDWFKKYGHIK